MSARTSEYSHESAILPKNHSLKGFIHTVKIQASGKKYSEGERSDKKNVCGEHILSFLLQDLFSL